jgi:hypothetical protein
MESAFDRCFEYVLQNEDSRASGAVTNEPNGAIARFGINSASHPEVAQAGFYTMGRDAALDYAKNLYKAGYWIPLSLEKLSRWETAAKLLDMAINMGNHATSLLWDHAIAALAIHLPHLG